MKYIQGNNRSQTYLFPISLEDSIGQDNEVRLIDLFVTSLNLRDYGFKVVFVENSRHCLREASAKQGLPTARQIF